MRFGPISSKQPISIGKLALAEIASCQLEFRALAHFTGKYEYARAVRVYSAPVVARLIITASHQVDRVTEHLRNNALVEGLYSTAYARTGEPMNSQSACAWRQQHFSL
jgi:hypothetical protein